MNGNIKIINIEFIDRLLGLVNIDVGEYRYRCCISSNFFQDKETTIDIEKIIDEQSDFEYNTDYVISTEGYFLHPDAFKICLMRLKTKKYANYYLLLEKWIKYYNDYQNNLKEKYIIKLDDKIDNLIQQNDKILHNNKELLEKSRAMEERSKKMGAQLNEALERLELTNDKLDDTKEELEEAHEKIDTTNNTLNLVARKLDIAVDDRVIKPKQLSILEKLKNNKSIIYYFLVLELILFCKTK